MNSVSSFEVCKVDAIWKVQNLYVPRPLDMRAGADRLAFLCKEEIGMSPYQGAVFLFFNRDRTRPKFIFTTALVAAFLKTLERGRFKVPVVPNGFKMRRYRVK